MKIRPLGDRVLVQRDAGEELSAGGIIIPGTAQADQNAGSVQAVGPDAQVEVGQRVHFRAYAGHVVGERLLLMQEDEILAVEVEA